MRAYVFIDTQVQMAAPVAKRLAAFQSSRGSVLSVETVTGPHDVIALLEAADGDAMGRMIVDSVHSLEGVEKTVSCLVLNDA